MRSLFLILLFLPAIAFAQDGSIAADPERMESRIEALGRFGTNPEGGVSRVADLEAATLAEVLRINVYGAFLCAREAVRRMSTARGAVGDFHRHERTLQP